MNLNENDSNDKIISIGQTFMIPSYCIWKWGKTEEKGFPTIYEPDNICWNDEYSDILFIFKYIGNGYVQEMVTGEIMFLTRIGNQLVEDDLDVSKLDVYDYIYYPARFEEYDEYADELGQKNIMMYIYRLKKYRKLIAESPCLICSLLDGDEMIEIDDDSKKKYLEHSSEERITLMKKFKEEALKSAEETIKDIDAELKKNSNNMTSEMLDMAYLENDIYNFKNQGRTK